MPANRGPQGCGACAGRGTGPHVVVTLRGARPGVWRSRDARGEPRATPSLSTERDDESLFSFRASICLRYLPADLFFFASTRIDEMSAYAPRRIERDIASRARLHDHVISKACSLVVPLAAERPVRRSRARAGSAPAWSATGRGDRQRHPADRPGILIESIAGARRRGVTACALASMLSVRQKRWRARELDSRLEVRTAPSTRCRHRSSGIRSGGSEVRREPLQTAVRQRAGLERRHDLQSPCAGAQVTVTVVR